MLNQANLDALRAGVRQEMDKAGLGACQYAVAVDGEVAYDETIGAPSDARFLLMSSTKPLIASVVWQLIGEGMLDPALPVTTWWPDFGRHDKDLVTLEQVMAHTAGFPNAPLSEGANFNRDRRVAEMQEWTLDWQPGTRYEYHGISGHWVLSELIHRLTGHDYRSALRARVLDPMGLDRVELGVPPERQGDVQQLRYVGTPPSIEEIVEFLGVPLSTLGAMANAPAAGGGGADIVSRLGEPEFLAAGVPGGGAVADAASYAVFYQHLLHDPKGLWDPAVLRDAKTNVRNLHKDFLGRAAYRTLGLEQSGDDDKAHMRIGYGATSPGTFGHSGAGGQVAWADPETGLSFVFLTNYFDAHFPRQYRREATLSRLAAACAR